VEPAGHLELVLCSVLPTDPDSRADSPAWTACYAVALTDPVLGVDGAQHPDALAAFLTARLARAQQEARRRPTWTPPARWCCCSR